MKVMLLVVALTVSAALAGAVTYMASSSQAVASHESALVASAGSDIESNP